MASMHKLIADLSRSVQALILDRQSSLVAIKIARADARQALEELRLYRRLAATDTNRNHIVLPLHDFPQVGLNGTHQCLVFEPMGPSVGLVLEGTTESSGDLNAFDEPPPPTPPSAEEAPSTTHLTLG